MESYGIKETKEALAFVFAGLFAWDMANADGELNLKDLVHLVPLFPTAGPAIEDIGQIPKEFLDLNNEEGAALVAYASAQLAGLADEHVVKIVGSSIGVVAAIGTLLKDIKDIRATGVEVKILPAIAG